MFKLVIVEDEDNIRHSLEVFIPWEKMGFRVVGAFSDGSTAFDYIKDNPCDVVLTDLLMSRMNGLELIGQLHQIHPEIKAVILSGHSDFALAQQAIRYQVVHYLVKPVDEDELMDVFKGIKEQLDREQEIQKTAESENHDLKLMLRKSFFRDLLAGRVVSEEELAIYLNLLNLQNIDSACPLLAFEVKEEKRSHNEGASEVEEVSLESAFQKYFANCSGFLLEDTGDHWCAVFVGTPGQDVAGLRKLCSEQLQEFTAALSGEYVFRLTHSAAAVRDLVAGLRVSSTALSNQVMDDGLYQSVVSDYKLLVLELDLGSRETLLHLLNDRLHSLVDTPLEDARFVLKNLYAVIELNYKKRKINVWDLTNGKFTPNHLYEAQEMETLAQCVREDFAALCSSLKFRKHSGDHSIVTQVVQFLAENIDKDFSQEVLAARYRIHPGYLSRLFKQDMGETLSEYVLRIKVERAAVLLKEGRFKVGEIAAMVGYSASSYFSIAFKKYAGCSPREYSQKVLL